MNGSDFRIGNIITDGVVSPCEIIEILKNGINCRYTQKSERQNVFFMPFNSIQPIELNKLQLLYRGFEVYKINNKKIDAYYKKTTIGDLMIRFYNSEIHLYFTKVGEDENGMWMKGKRFAGDEAKTLKIKYLHQLQNLHYTLLNEEL